VFHIILFEPEIPPNTGNIIRLCANTGSSLHLIHPLGFKIDDKRLRRAGLDYREYANLHEYDSIESLLRAVSINKLYACSTKGSRRYSEVSFQPGDAMIFGPESRGLPGAFLDSLGKDSVLRLPMVSNSRSLNLSNSVAVVLYEAWRQLGFPNAE
jgi:tRNA (cytidine/uridine-2'-O-)-methyltransferase